MLDSRPRGCGFEPHRGHCIMSLSKTQNSLFRIGSTQEDLSRHNWKIIDWDIKNQIKQKKNMFSAKVQLALIGALGKINIQEGDHDVTCPFEKPEPTRR